MVFRILGARVSGFQNPITLETLYKIQKEFGGPNLANDFINVVAPGFWALRGGFQALRFKAHELRVFPKIRGTYFGGPYSKDTTI